MTCLLVGVVEAAGQGRQQGVVLQIVYLEYMGGAAADVDMRRVGERTLGD